VEGLCAVCEVVDHSRVLFASSTAVYGQTDGSWVDESAPTEPRGFSGRVMLEAEALAQQHGGTAVRFGGIYGPGRTRLIDRIISGVAIAASDEPQYRSRIHRDDCAGVLAHLAELPRIEPVYVAVDNEPTDQRDVQQWFCAQLGRDVAELQPAAAAKRHGGNKRCRNGLLRNSGYRFEFPTYRHGYKPQLAAFAAESSSR